MPARKPARGQSQFRAISRLFERVEALTDGLMTLIFTAGTAQAFE